jgi:hypothetical protein
MKQDLSRHPPIRAERQLASALLAGGWLLIALAVATACFPALFRTGGFGGGVKVAATASTGVLLLLASAGVRQNRIALELGCFLLTLTGIAWLVHGLFPPRSVPLLPDAVLLVLLVVVVGLRRRAIDHRFSPRFFSLRQFETMTQIADTMLELEGAPALHPIEVALRVDRLLSDIESELKNDIKTVMVLVEWVLPLLTFRPFPFSDLGSNARREVVNRVIGSRGLFRDVARTLKLLACAGYYGSPEGMASVGFVPFTDRPRSVGIDLTPLTHIDPHAAADAAAATPQPEGALP